MKRIPKANGIVDKPKLVDLPFLTFLRNLKRKQRGLRRLLQEAAKHWKALTPGQKNLFQKQQILSRVTRSTRNRLCQVLHKSPSEPSSRAGARTYKKEVWKPYNHRK